MNQPMHVVAPLKIVILRSLVRAVMKSKFKCLVGILLFVVNGTLAQEDKKGEQAAPKVDEKPAKTWVSSVDPKKFAVAETAAHEKQAQSELKQISKNIQRLKSDVIRLNKDLRDMEEKLLFPSNTRFSVFVSLSSGQFFRLESVKLKLNGKLVATQLFSDKQRAALSRGGIHRLYITNLNEGMHTATAFFTGIDNNGRALKRASNVEFRKGIGSEYLELAVVDDGATQEAKFQMKRW
ncbi:MAG: AraC family transcriptional regulator [Cellvibrionaceae bacterium]|nr:AraC family transcriptional regulator [Cellvibrionaceae bacterium]